MDKMPLLAVYDDRNYDPTWERHVRHAVRSVILRGDTVALVKSTAKGFYQFPGGGIDPGETHEQALIRETLEESGLVVLPQTIRPLGMTREVRASQFVEQVIFDQTSYFYFAQVQDHAREQVLLDYEKDLGYELEWVNLPTAIQVNYALAPNYDPKTKFVRREAEVLELLLNDPSLR